MQSSFFIVGCSQCDNLHHVDLLIYYFILGTLWTSFLQPFFFVASLSPGNLHEENYTIDLNAVSFLWSIRPLKIYTKFTLTDLNLVRYCFAQAKSFPDRFQCFALCLKSDIDILSTLRWSVDTQGWLLRGYWITAYYCLLCAHLFFDQMLLLCIWCQATKITLPSHCGGRARHSDWEENILIMVVYNKIFS